MRLKAQLMDEEAVTRSISRISYEIMEKIEDLDNCVIVGIHTRGVPFANAIADRIASHTGKRPPVGELDISLYRDDLKPVSSDPTLNDINLPFDIKDKIVVLADDVLYTGRTARAGIDALFTAGRPRAIRLAVLVDRGHRELPIRADFVGKNVPTSQREVIAVHFPQHDGDLGVYLFEHDL